MTKREPPYCLADCTAYTQGIEADMRVQNARISVLIDLLRDTVLPLEVSADCIEGDDTAEMAALIKRIKIALTAHDQRRVTFDGKKAPENVRVGEAYDDPRFEELARTMDVWGRADGALCAQFWLAGRRAGAPKGRKAP